MNHCTLNPKIESTIVQLFQLHQAKKQLHKSTKHFTRNFQRIKKNIVPNFLVIFIDHYYSKKCIILFLKSLKSEIRIIQKYFLVKFVFLKIVIFKLINTFWINYLIYLDLKCEFMSKKCSCKLAYLDYETKSQATNLNLK